MALVHLLLRTRVQVVDPHPRIRHGPGHESISVERVQRSAGRGMRKLDRDRRVLSLNVQEMHLLARRHAQRATAMSQLHGRDSLAQVESRGLRQGPQVPPPHKAVLTGRHANSAAVELVPDKTADNPIARKAFGVLAKDKRFGVRTTEVKEANLLLVAPLHISRSRASPSVHAHGKKILGLLLGVQGHSPDDVVVLKGVKRLACSRVPYLTDM